MLRFNPRLFAAVGLLPLVLGTGAHAPSADASPLPSIAKTSRVQTVSARSEADHSADIPGVTYPRAAPPDLAPRMTLVEPSVAAPSADKQSDVQAAPTVEAAPAPKAEPEVKAPRITLKLDVDLAEQRLTVTEGGEVKHVWLISSGRAGHATGTGTFRPQWASRMWYSRQYDMAPMPHAVFFNRGIAFHATAATHLLGRPASHGCVRLSPQNARLLYAMIHRHGFQSTEIKVFGSPKVAGQGTRKPRTAAEPRKRAPENASNSPFGTWSFF